MGDLDGAPGLDLTQPWLPQPSGEAKQQTENLCLSPPSPSLHPPSVTLSNIQITLLRRNCKLKGSSQFATHREKIASIENGNERSKYKVVSYHLSQFTDSKHYSSIGRVQWELR